MKYYLFITKKGLVKKTPAEEYQNIRPSGLVAVKLDKEDELLSVKVTTGEDEVILITSFGKSIRFSEKDIRPTGRATRGVTGIRLQKDDKVVGAGVIEKNQTKKGLKLLVVSTNGFGKKTKLSEYKRQQRGGQGMFTAKVTEKTGSLISAQLLNSQKSKGVNEKNAAGQAELLIISTFGKVIRLKLMEVPTLGRQTQGVHLIRLNKKDKAAAVTVID